MFRPWDDNVKAGDETGPTCALVDAVAEDFAIDELLDDYVADDAGLGVWEGVDEADGGEGNGLFNGADGPFIIFVIEHPFGECDIHL